MEIRVIRCFLHKIIMIISTWEKDYKTKRICVLAAPWNMQNLSSPTRARTCALSTSAVEAQSLNNGLPGKIVKEYILF